MHSKWPTTNDLQTKFCPQKRPLEYAVADGSKDDAHAKGKHEVFHVGRRDAQSIK